MHKFASFYHIDVTDLHISMKCMQPFIFYSFCHLWPWQLLSLTHVKTDPVPWYAACCNLCCSCRFSTCFTSCFTAETNLAFSPHVPFGLFPSMTATQDRTRLHWCCSPPDSCRTFSTQTESVALKSVNTSVCVLLTAPSYKKTGEMVQSIFLFGLVFCVAKTQFEFRGIYSIYILIFNHPKPQLLNS